jgi:mRNA deadenylase 3'-5' endonuclease subunit Ccr4
MSKAYTGILILIILLGCGKNKSVPSGVLPAKKMEAILWDLMRADQFVTLHILPKDSSLKKETEHKKWHDKILAIHQLNEQDFQNSFHYYKEHPKLFQEILDTISLSKKYEPVFKTDSTKTVQPSLNYDSLKKVIEQKSSEHRIKQSRPMPTPLPGN